MASVEGEQITTRAIRALKGKRPIVAITAYDAVLARLIDAAGVDILLVGDSVGTTLLGMETTIPVTLDMMVHHTAAVARANPQALLVADVPFGVAHGEWGAVLAGCQRLMQEGGAQAVKIEGNAALAPTIARLVEAGIPVWGHLGLLPQRFHAMGGYRKFGKTEAGRERLLRDARVFEEAGCFALLGEMIEDETAKHLTESVEAPFVGIGCGPHCDGQILVSTDLLAMGTGPYPSFVKPFAEVGAAIQQGVQAYAEAVRNRSFPS